MSDPVRLAFVGVDNPHGAGWRDLLLNLGDQVEITAIMPGYGGATASLEERYADLPRFDSVEQLIDAATFDAAVVCLPNNAGPAAVTQLADAGKHVLCEKPIAGSAHDARSMCEAVRGAGVAFQSGYMWRYDHATERLKRMIDEGRFGRLIGVEMLMVTSDVRRRGADHYLFDRSISTGGFFNWLACHYLDLLLYLTGDKVVGVTARADVYGETDVDVEDGGAAIMELGGGGLATFTGGYWIPRWAGENHVCIRGSQRWVHWRPGEGPGGTLEIHGPQPQWYAMEDKLQLPADDTPGYGGRQGVALVSDWLRAIREGGDCRNTPESTLATLELIDAIYDSSREGKHVECSIG